MAIAGATSHAIGAQLHRSEKAVRARALRLRIILRRPKDAALKARDDPFRPALGVHSTGAKVLRRCQEHT